MMAPAFLWILVFGLYVVTAWPTVAVGDSGELVTAAYHLGIAHPPGYPLYVVLTKLVSVLLPLGSVAFRANMACAVAASGAAVGVFKIGQCLGWPSLVAVGVAGVFATLGTGWSQAITAEVYAFQIALIAGLVCAWVMARRISFFPCAAVAGLLLTNHHTAFLVLLPVGVWVLRSTPWRAWVMLGLVGVLGAALYVELPLRSMADPVADWGNPETLKGVGNVFLRKQYGALATAPRTLSLMAGQGLAYLESLGRQAPWLWWMWGLVGVWAWGRARDPGWGVVGASALICGLGVWWGLGHWVTPH